ncbi:MAG: hypothetical protein BM557_09865 [Flavobacterium sp. MedPE-SWcel]|uniref:hypothetical protein n=1 Tax=uncultured Flavobacterium sp. TaxID=165435 RepID=UPI000917F21F|nr:hypothetical protein [uncultured Flavobacterium sp.]OIQ16608.1 MAG: hypothetical protein BM557_09865 [Flavobacterium sp. MedPE-SWcel]
MNNTPHTPDDFLYKRQSKYTNSYAFLLVVKHLNLIPNQLIIKLSQRFRVSPETLVLLINIYRKEGGQYEN